MFNYIFSYFPVLHKAGRHMEDTLIGSYIVLIIGYLILDDKVRKEQEIPTRIISIGVGIDSIHFIDFVDINDLTIILMLFILLMLLMLLLLLLLLMLLINCLCCFYWFYLRRRRKKQKCFYRAYGWRQC